MKQRSHAELWDHRHAEERVEWTRGWGLNMRLPELEIGNHASVTNGTGRPGVAQNSGRDVALAAPAVSGNILAAPRGPLTLDEVHVTTHQISISLPIH